MCFCEVFICQQLFSLESVHVNTYLCWQNRLVTGSTFWCENPRVQEEIVQITCKASPKSRTKPSHQQNVNPGLYFLVIFREKEVYKGRSTPHLYCIGLPDLQAQSVQPYSHICPFSQLSLLLKLFKFCRAPHDPRNVTN